MSSTVFLTVSQAAKELSVSRQAIQQWIKSRRLMAHWMLERWAIPMTEIERLKNQRSRKKAA